MRAFRERTRTAILWLAVLVAALQPCAVALAAPAARVDLDARIRCEEAIERVYWRHRTSDSQQTFEQAVPQSMLRHRAEDALRKEAALRQFWQVDVTALQVQAELDRMAAGSQATGRLREIFVALGDDPNMAAECLARPMLVDRLIRSLYAHDARLHGDVRALATRELGKAAQAEGAVPASGIRSELAWRRGHDQALDHERDARELPPAEFDTRVDELAHALGGQRSSALLGQPPALREDDLRFYTIAIHEFDQQHVRATATQWPKRPFEAWWQETRGQWMPEAASKSFAYRLPDLGNTPCVDDTWTPTMQLLDPRYWHTAVWTGSEMIVFGGMSNVGNIYGDGSRYDPATDTWQLLPTAGAPGARQSHAAVWTGAEMVVWGGRADSTGGRYNPTTNTWAPTSLSGAPVRRANPSFVWSGTEMLVWGGEGDTGALNSGGRYNPATDTWTAMPTAPLAPRVYHTAVWTGAEMIVWGGSNSHIGQLYGDGARFNPVSNNWTPIAASGAPNARTYHSAVWTGTQMIVWGGANEPVFDSSGGRYNPATNTWTPTSVVNAPQYRIFHTAVWTGTQMIVQGGSGAVSITGGARYDPLTDIWTPTSPVNSTTNGQGITAVWTGTEMIIWGGIDENNVFRYDGSRYNPQLDSWRPTGTMNVPAARGLHAAVWTGSEMIVWGGSGWSGSFAPGSRYDPATDSWRSVSAVDAPFTAETGLWTGTEAIFWEGGALGGRYNPTSDSWVVMSTINAPQAGPGYSMVWTGSEMIVFGGIGTDSIARRYRPATNSWIDASAVDAPGPRDHHAAVWTGTEMIIWGGFINDGTTPTGGRYNPITDTWVPTNLSGSPITRMWPVSVWTGTEMLVWGGNDWLFLGDLDDGARYNPVSDSWTPINPSGAPTPRMAQGVWTGSELLLWGGTSDRSGGRYNPATNAWRPTSVVNAPEQRIGGRWSTVWTGTEMIIWGGIVETQRGARYCVGPVDALFANGFE